ncbi:ABC transporter ATP-binding protein [Sporolactobacillus shoreae]|uniref:ABC transporter ATP-binding protein n=1 Tax=Sporolactobacillus shoreae TaxID=1465501 RepID=A0A4Z0GRM0_9BACL|nr:ABC transporter ATP-binding protein [Sporolactobacillus shoreae]TGA98875.1 ABC transporter ATP-binding protein [Sporolactobacillus shoreae]
MDILRAEHIRKNFGSQHVLTDLNFSVSKHSIFGLIGKNGSGKTTTMKMILGLIKPTSGSIYVCGEKVAYGDTPTNRHIGYLPDVPEFYGYMTAREYLKLCGEITGVRRSEIHKRTDELLCLVGLNGVNRKIHSYSRGMKQRLGIAQALLNEPELLICDEVTSALDPVGRKEILDLLSAAGKRATVIFSTHILSDVERICDQIGVLNNGQLELQGPLNEIKQDYRQEALQIETLTPDQAPVLAAHLKALPFISKAEVSGRTVNVQLNHYEENSLDIIRLLASESIPILKYERLEPTLENVFMDVIR